MDFLNNLSNDYTNNQETKELFENHYKFSKSILEKLEKREYTSFTATEFFTILKAVGLNNTELNNLYLKEKRRINKLKKEQQKREEYRKPIIKKRDLSIFDKYPKFEKEVEKIIEELGKKTIKNYTKNQNFEYTFRKKGLDAFTERSFFNLIKSLKLDEEKLKQIIYQKNLVDPSTLTLKNLLIELIKDMDGSYRTKAQQIGIKDTALVNFIKMPNKNGDFHIFLSILNYFKITDKELANFFSDRDNVE